MYQYIGFHPGCRDSRCKIKKWYVTESAIFKNHEPDDEPPAVDLRQSRKRLSGRKCCSQCHPYVNPMQSGPFRWSGWSLPSRTIDRSIDWSIVRLCSCLIHFTTLWFRENMRFMTLRRRRNGWSRNRGRSLGSVYGAWSAASVRARWFQNTFSPPLCKLWGAETHGL